MSSEHAPLPEATTAAEEALMNNPALAWPGLAWEDVPEDEAPPVMSEANAAELLRQAAAQD